MEWKFINCAKRVEMIVLARVSHVWCINVGTDPVCEPKKLGELYYYGLNLKHH